MNSILKKIFGTLTEKPWEANQAAIDSKHTGQTFNISNQMSVVIIIFGISSVLFSLIFTGYLYSLPPGQDTTFILKTNMLWINTLVLIMVTYFFDKIRRDFNNNLTHNIKKNLIIVGALSYLFLILQLILWYQLMIDGNYVSTNTYFSSFYFLQLYTASIFLEVYSFGERLHQKFSN